LIVKEKRAIEKEEDKQNNELFKETFKNKKRLRSIEL